MSSPGQIKPSSVDSDDLSPQKPAKARARNRKKEGSDDGNKRRCVSTACVACRRYAKPRTLRILPQTLADPMLDLGARARSEHHSCHVMYKLSNLATKPAYPTV